MRGFGRRLLAAALALAVGVLALGEEVSVPVLAASGNVGVESSAASGNVEMDAGVSSGDVKAGTGESGRTVKTGTGAVSGTVKTESSDAGGTVKADKGSSSETVKTDTGAISGTAGTDTGAASGTTGTDSGASSGNTGADTGAASGTIGTDSEASSVTADTENSAAGGTAEAEISAVSGIMEAELYAASGSVKTDTSVASVTADGTTTYYEDIYEAWTAAQGKTATVWILQDVTMGKWGDPLKIEDANTDITLEMAEGSGILDGPKRYIEVNAGSLTMKSGKIVSTQYGGVGIQVTGASFQMDGGYIEVLNFDYTLRSTYGVYAGEGSNSNIHITGGEIRATCALGMKDSTVTVTGGEFMGIGRNFFPASGITAKICDASISGGSFRVCPYEDGTGVGNAIDVLGGSVRVSGGVFREETGRGICIHANGDGCRLELTGGSFYGDNFVLSGGGLYLLQPGGRKRGCAYVQECGCEGASCGEKMYGSCVGRLDRQPGRHPHPGLQSLQDGGDGAPYL